MNAVVSANAVDASNDASRKLVKTTFGDLIISLPPGEGSSNAVDKLLTDIATTDDNGDFKPFDSILAGEQRCQSNTGSALESFHSLL